MSDNQEVGLVNSPQQNAALFAVGNLEAVNPAYPDPVALNATAYSAGLLLIFPTQGAYSELHEGTAHLLPKKTAFLIVLLECMHDCIFCDKTSYPTIIYS